MHTPKLDPKVPIGIGMAGVAGGELQYYSNNKLPVSINQTAIVILDIILGLEVDAHCG